MTANHLTSQLSRSNRQKRLHRKSDEMPENDHPKRHSIRGFAAGWIGYIIKLERQRHSITQTHLASELGFGMSYVSTIESGNAFANIERTMKLIRFFGINSCTCIGAIEAQLTIQKLLQESQKREKQRASQRPQWNQSTLSYHQVVADKAIDTPDQSHASWQNVLRNHRYVREVE